MIYNNLRLAIFTYNWMVMRGGKQSNYLYLCLACGFEKLTSVSVGIRRGGKTGICPCLEIGTKNQTFLENLKLAAKFR